MVHYENTTLMIRHFPPEVPKEDKISFMKHFGAVEVKCLESKLKKKNLIFARFENRSRAEIVMKKLHQIELFGQLLSVEFARNNPPLNNLSQEKIGFEEVKDERSRVSLLYDVFLQKLNNWTGELKLEQPPPVHLKYMYPPPDRHVLSNIASALAAVPKFYTQVLHLMNKMNLPCPFVDDYPIRSELIFIKSKTWEDKAIDTKDIAEDEEEEESEIESDGEVKPEEIIPMKRPRKCRRVLGRLPTRKALGRPQTGKSGVKPEEVFEGIPQPQQPKKIELRLSASLDSIKETPQVDSVGFPKMEPLPKPILLSEQNQTEEEQEPSSVITYQELVSNRISSKDQHLLPVFKNYQPGLHSCRLYIKNLAKTVVERDLHFIYRRYLIENTDEEQGTMFDIRLMQEGRMKGQAFVTLQNTTQAAKALQETNGYILKGKPMVVHFARSAKSK